MQKGKYLKDKQLALFRSVSQQLLQHWMNVQILYFKMNIQDTKVNIYGQTIGPKQFYKGMRIPGIIQHNPTQFQFMEAFVTNTTNFKFLKSTLQKFNLFPQMGDYIVWDDSTWQIGNVTSQQLIGNDIDTQWSYVCQSTLTSNTKAKSLANFTGKPYAYGKEE